MMNGQALRALWWVWCGVILGCGERSASNDPPASPPGSSPAEMTVGATAAGTPPPARAAAATSGGTMRGGTAGITASKPPADASASDADGGASSDVPMTGASAAADGGTQGAREYTLSMCPGATPRVLPAERTDCDGLIRCGGKSRCLAGMSDQAGRAPECSGGRCVPDVVAVAGRIRFQPCEGTGGPGVCIPQCFAVQRNPLSAVFEQGEAGCGTQEVCVPCLSPLDRSDTGACDDTCVETTEPN